MKNLKKILIALAVIALVVSSLVLIVSAEGEYTGDIKKMYDNYQKVVNAPSAAGKASTLAEAYTYLSGYPVDPNSSCQVEVGSGDNAETITVTYAEIIAQMNASSVEIGEMLYNDIASANTADERLSAVQALLDHIAACTPTETTTGYAELVAKVDVQNAAVITEQFQLANELATTADKQTAFVAIANYMNKYPLDATANADLIAAIDAALLGFAKQLYTEWSEIAEEDANYHARYNGIYSAKYYIASIGYLVNGAVSPTASAEAKEIASSIISGCAIMDGEKAAKQIALDAQASFDEYDFGKPFMTFDCESSMLNNYNANAECYASAAVDVFGNKYHNFHYGENAVHLYTEPQIGNKNAYQLGMVVEWDQMFDDGFTASEYVCRHPSVAMTTAFQINKSADGIAITNILSDATGRKVEKVTHIGAIATNVWEHFTLTYDHETRTGKLYVNYAYICDIEYSDTPTFQFVGLRMGKSVTNQNHGYDNFVAMNGSQYRIWDKFENMSETEKFDYYVNYMVNEENPSLSRNAAYNKAKILYLTIKEKYADKCADSLAAYSACNYNEDIKKPAMAENLVILSEMVDELLAMAVNSGTTADVNGAIAEINNFVSVNGELINKGDTSEGGYQSLMMKVNNVKADLIKIENVTAFVSALTKFARATTIASMSKYAEAAQAVYVIAEYDIPENVDFVKNDPVVLSFETSINGEEIKPGDEGYITLFEYYETVAEKLASRSLYENAKRIISCMNFITSMEGYEATTEFWTANADYISDYVNIARSVIISGNYDTTVAGLDEAIATFNALDVCFYELLQQQHIAVLEEQLAKYISTEIYIDKVGVCAVVAEYLAENDIAIYNTTMTPAVAAAVADEIAKLEELVVKYGVYADELAAQEEDYEAVLAQNTQYFINTVNHMTTVLTYAELKPMFDKATGYYYSIDVNSEEAAAAADKYIAYREQLEAWETNGAIFIGFVDGLAVAEVLEGVEREDAIYEILVNCTAYIDLIDASVKGVGNAVAEYEEALAAYNAELDIVNGDINESAKITCAVRTGSISTIVLAIVSKIFGN